MNMLCLSYTPCATFKLRQLGVSTEHEAVRHLVINTTESALNEKIKRKNLISVIL